MSSTPGEPPSAPATSTGKRRRPMRYRLEHAAFVAARGLILALPHPAVRRLGRAVGRLYHAVDAGRREIALRNMELALPEVPAEERRRLVRLCFEQNGASFFETVSAQRFDRPAMERYFSLGNPEYLEQAVSAGRGVIMITAHYGAFELGLYPLALAGGQLHVLGRPPDNPHIAVEVARMRGSVGVSLIPRRGSGRRMLNLLRQGQSVVMVIDQRTLPRDGILTTFLGQPAWASPLAAMLSTHTGAPVIAARCVPRPCGCHCLVIDPPVWPEGRGDEVEAALTRRYLEQVERWIHDRPELWLWMHRRFRLTFRHESSKGIVRNRKESGFPPQEGLDGADLPEPGALELRELTRTEFLEASGDVLFLGEPEEARNRLARHVGQRLLDQGNTVRYATAGALARELLAAREKGKLARLYRRLDGFELLLLEELDRAALSDAEAAELARLLDQRHGRRATLISAGFAGEERIRRLGGRPEAIASFERWLRRARPIRLER